MLWETLPLAILTVPQVLYLPRMKKLMRRPPLTQRQPRVLPGPMQTHLWRLPEREAGQEGDQGGRELVLGGPEGGGEAAGEAEDLLS